MTLQAERRLSAEQCLQLPPADVATRCPNIAGRLFTVGSTRYALIERAEPQRATMWCDQNGSHWRCRRVVVIDHELTSAGRRNPQVYMTASELLRFFTSAPSLRIGEELGGLSATGERPRTCIEVGAKGCATQSARVKMNSSHGPIVKKSLWFVEDGDGPTMLCTDAKFTHCDLLDAAGWFALAVALRPSSQAPALPNPEFGVPSARADKRPGARRQALGTDVAETSAGALDPIMHGKTTLPHTPSHDDATRLADTLDERGRTCISGDHANVELTLSGDGSVMSLSVDGAQKGAPHDCLVALARRIPLPRFSDPSWHLTAMIRRQ